MNPETTSFGVLCMLGQNTIFHHLLLHWDPLWPCVHHTHTYCEYIGCAEKPTFFFSELCSWRTSTECGKYAERFVFITHPYVKRWYCSKPGVGNTGSSDVGTNFLSGCVIWSSSLEGKKLESHSRCARNELMWESLFPSMSFKEGGRLTNH